jgi:hypothetical protein
MSRALRSGQRYINNCRIEMGSRDAASINTEHDTKSPSPKQLSALIPCSGVTLTDVPGDRLIVALFTVT